MAPWNCRLKLTFGLVLLSCRPPSVLVRSATAVANAEADSNSSTSTATAMGDQPPPQPQHFAADSQFIRDIEQSAIDEFNRENPYEQSFFNDVAGFIAAVDWRWSADGQWLAAVAALHLMYFSLIVCFRRVEVVQLGVFVSICGMVLVAESINAFLHENWRAFATQDYFDAHGVFLSVLFSGPLLLMGFLQLILVLCYVKDMVIHVKRAELRFGSKEAREKKRAHSKPKKRKNKNHAGSPSKPKRD